QRQAGLQEKSALIARLPLRQQGSVVEMEAGRLFNHADINGRSHEDRGGDESELLAEGEYARPGPNRFPGDTCSRSAASPRWSPRGSDARARRAARARSDDRADIHSRRATAGNR